VKNCLKNRWWWVVEEELDISEELNMVFTQWKKKPFLRKLKPFKKKIVGKEYHRIKISGEFRIRGGCLIIN
jgi:hypothetical protein